MGGTFDPVHLGHIRMAQAAHTALDLDRVVLIPCAVSPHKSDVPRPAPGECRKEMIRLAVRDYPWMEVDGCELERDGVSYSWQTAEVFRHRYPGACLFWILGEDQWQALPRWSRPEYLAEMVDFIVFGRNARNPEPRKGVRAHFLPWVHEASASEIRRELQSGRDLDAARQWLPPGVMDFIHKRGLYQNG